MEVSKRELNLSGDASSDRDNPNLQVSFQWSYKNKIGTKCRHVDGSLFMFASTRVSVIPVLPYDNLCVFKVTVSSEDGHTATVQSRISVWSGPTDNITVALRQEAKSLMCGVDDVNVGVRVSMTARTNVTRTNTNSLLPPHFVWSLQWSEIECNDDPSPCAQFVVTYCYGPCSTYLEGINVVVHMQLSVLG